MKTKIPLFLAILAVTGIISYSVEMAALNSRFRGLESSPQNPTAVHPGTETQLPAVSASPTLPTATSTPDPLTNNTPIPLDGPIHAIRLDYSDMEASRSLVIPLEQEIRNSGFNMVSLGAGRAEWTYFKWNGHPDAWSSEVKDTGIDYLAVDSARFGQWARVDAAVDVLSPLYIQRNPNAAAISFDGKPSPDLVSTMQLVNGEYGKLVLEMIDAIAANYPVESISINEMFYHLDGYGPDDKASYMSVTKSSDWPRTPDGKIDINDPLIDSWRSYELNIFIGKAQEIAHKYGKLLYANVAVALDNAETPTVDYGERPDVILEKADKILLWGYFDLDTYNPDNLQNVAQYLLRYGDERLIFVIGLWNKLNQPVSADKISRAVEAVQKGGLVNIWITPASLMDDSHWNAIAALWK